MAIDKKNLDQVTWIFFFPLILKQLQMERIPTCGLATIPRGPALGDDSYSVEELRQFPFLPLTLLPRAKPEVIRPPEVLPGSLYQVDQSGL